MATGTYAQLEHNSVSYSFKPQSGEVTVAGMEPWAKSREVSWIALRFIQATFILADRAQ
jgi:hypothetical protein